MSEKRLIRLTFSNFETRYESNFACLTKVLSQMRLSEGTPLKPAQVLKHATKNSTEQTAMRMKFAKGVAGTVSLPIFSVFFFRFSFFSDFFRFFSLFFPCFLPFFSVFFRFIFRKEWGDTVRETPFAKPREMV